MAGFYSARGTMNAMRVRLSAVSIFTPRVAEVGGGVGMLPQPTISTQAHTNDGFSRSYTCTVAEDDVASRITPKERGMKRRALMLKCYTDFVVNEIWITIYIPPTHK
ncbi:hypothetical protein EYC84_001681 [Monilinia fructicola]|uniref:Uncharacterized protein n=1 Tax=Monilinia fructicola TaxID=38448 RepID=A0A5M9JSV9_MONFR|nr:hypothetical protein EYC84_001681 [Monilinia fructicola]